MGFEKNPLYQKGYRQGMIDAGFCPNCKDESSLCHYDETTQCCDADDDDEDDDPALASKELKEIIEAIRGYYDGDTEYIRSQVCLKWLAEYAALQAEGENHG